MSTPTGPTGPLGGERGPEQVSGNGQLPAAATGEAGPRLAPYQPTVQTDQLTPQNPAIPPQPVVFVPEAVVGAPAPPQAPVVGRPAVGRRSPRLLSRRENAVTLTLLCIMAFADAAGFWIALSEMIQSYEILLIIVVAALSVGTVALAHQIGRWVRSRRESCDGSLAWICVMTVLWLGLAAVTFWIRDVSPPLDSTPNGQTQLQIALLFLCIYLITGALAMTHAYRSGDPVSAELREARRRRRQQITDFAQAERERRLAEARLAVRREDLQREQEQFERDQELGDLIRGETRTLAQLDIAEAEGHPSATDALTDPRPPEPGPGPGGAQGATPDPTTPDNEEENQ